MSKQSKILFIILLVVVAILATSTGFFFSKSRKLENSSDVQISPTPTSINAVSTAGTTPTPAKSSAVAKPASTANKPSAPADTYTVSQGDTLMIIAENNSVSATALTDANGIENWDMIRAGQALIIPKNNMVSFMINQEKADELQKEADAGKVAFRLSPEETAKSDAPSAYGLTVDDTYTLKTSGAKSAEVLATHNEKGYLIKLTQPSTEGEKGIWAITSIEPA